MDDENLLRRGTGKIVFQCHGTRNQLVGISVYEEHRNTGILGKRFFGGTTFQCETAAQAAIQIDGSHCCIRRAAQKRAHTLRDHFFRHRIAAIRHNGCHGIGNDRFPGAEQNRGSSHGQSAQVYRKCRAHCARISQPFQHVVALAGTVSNQLSLAGAVASLFNQKQFAVVFMIKGSTHAEIPVPDTVPTVHQYQQTSGVLRMVPVCLQCQPFPVDQRDFLGWLFQQLLRRQAHLFRLLRFTLLAGTKSGQAACQRGASPGNNTCHRIGISDRERRCSQHCARQAHAGTRCASVFGVSLGSHDSSSLLRQPSCSAQSRARAP